MTPFSNQNDLREMLKQARESVNPPSQEGTNQQQINAGESTPNGGHEAAVPYERFREVNQRASEYEQRLRLLEDERAQLLRNGNAPQQPTQQSAQPTAQDVAELLTPQEIESLESEALVRPGETLRRLAQLIQERGVKTEVKRAVDQLRQEMGGYVQQVQGILGPSQLSGYKQRHFATPQSKSVEPVFDQIVNAAVQQNPQIIYNEEALDSLRLMALGRAVEQGLVGGQQAGKQNGNVPFSENPTGPSNPFSGFGGENKPSDVPQEVGLFASRLGVDPKVANQLYTQMKQQGIYRD